MRRFLGSLLGLLVGYLLFAFVAYWAIELLSDNHHDRDMEAIMTAVFAAGPLGALLGLVTGFVLGKAKPRDVG